ncbi:MAG: DUF1987 domain-containing protein [Bacteroidales bacterium]|nr:DUF1987 domain-containing protein [Bacteroidales bacterium]
MNPLHYEATECTPYINLDKDNNIFEIRGVSKPSNVFEFYDPVLNWLDEYMDSPNPKTMLSIRLEYINSASAKVINFIIKKLERAIKKGKESVVLWHYSVHEPDMKELGENYSIMYNIPFEFKSYE